jgi:hypothetical protein
MIKKSVAPGNNPVPEDLPQLLAKFFEPALSDDHLRGRLVLALFRNIDNEALAVRGDVEDTGKRAKGRRPPLGWPHKEKPWRTETRVFLIPGINIDRQD